MNVNLRNLGTVNKNQVTLEHNNKEVTFYFSYETIVAVANSKGFFVSKNDWSTTTGKILNELQPDHKKRVGHSEVLKQVEIALKNLLI